MPKHGLSSSAQEGAVYTLPAWRHFILTPFLAARQLGLLYDEALAPLDLKATQLALIARNKQAHGRRSTRTDPAELATLLAIQLSALTHALRTRFKTRVY